MTYQEIITWLLSGDPSIQYQTKKDLLNINDLGLQGQIQQKGWGQQFLSLQNKNGHWGQSYYQPKWIATHYTLLDLRNLNISPQIQNIQNTLREIIARGKAKDGGIRLGPSTMEHSDVCVNGMFLNAASYFQVDPPGLNSLVDALILQQMPDGGFNCRTTRSGATHSSLHSTISVIEGLTTYMKHDYSHQLEKIKQIVDEAVEFILAHRLFMSDHTGKIIRKDFLKLSFPSRWKYDILRALDYFRYAGLPWDERMSPSIEVLLKKRNKNGSWNMQAAHPGKVHFVMEKAGTPGRWNTLRCLRVLKHFGIASP